MERWSKHLHDWVLVVPAPLGPSALGGEDPADVQPLNAIFRLHQLSRLSAGHTDGGQHLRSS